MPTLKAFSSLFSFSFIFCCTVACVAKSEVFLQNWATCTLLQWVLFIIFLLKQVDPKRLAGVNQANKSLWSGKKKKIVFVLFFFVFVHWCEIAIMQ